MALDRFTPGLSPPQSGAGFMDDVRAENAALWLRSRDLLYDIGGDANSITAKARITITSYAAPLRFLLIPLYTNTVQMMINIDGLGFIDLRDRNNAALPAGAIIKGRAYPIDLLEFSPDAFRIITPMNQISARSYVTLISARQANGTAGGTATSGSYLTYPLNTVLLNQIVGAEFNSSNNRITLPAGIYDVEAVAQFYQTGVMRIRLRNITAGATVTGARSSGRAATGDTLGTTAELVARFTLTAPATFELQYRVTNTNADDGLGQAAKFTDQPEDFGNLRITKVSP